MLHALYQRSFLLPTADKSCKGALWFFVLFFVDGVVVEVVYTWNMHVLR